MNRRAAGITDKKGPKGDRPPRKRRFQFGLKHLLALPVWVALFFAVLSYFGAIGAIVLVLLTLFLIAIYLDSFVFLSISAGIFLALLLLLRPDLDSRPPSPRAGCANNLKQIALALRQYDVDYGCFPPAYVADQNGRPMHSWRVLILPYLEQEALYDRYRFDEPWDGPNNRKLAELVLSVFRCPLEEGQPSTMTSYLAVVGPQTAWPGSKPTKLADITDGASNTLLVVEVKDSGIHWMEPRDLHVVQMAPGVNAKAGQGIASGHPGGAQVAFADGRVKFFSEDTPPDAVGALLTINGQESVEP